MILPSKRALTRIIAPATEPLTLAETKLYLRIDGNTEDSLVTDLIIAARQAAEKYLRASLITQQWKLSCDDYVPEKVSLSYGPVISVVSVTVYERDNSSYVIDPSLYYLNSNKDGLKFDTILYGQRIEIIYNTGYGNSVDIPTPIKYGMLAHIAAMYEQRGEEQATFTRQSIALYAPFREVTL